MIKSMSWTHLNRVREKRDARTHLSCRGLSTFIHPPTRKYRVLNVCQIKETKCSQSALLALYGPQTPPTKTPSLLCGECVKKTEARQTIMTPVPGQDGRCSFQRRRPVCVQTRATIPTARSHPPPHVAQQWFPTTRRTYPGSAIGTGKAGK